MKKLILPLLVLLLVSCSLPFPAASTPSVISPTPDLVQGSTSLPTTLPTPAQMAEPADILFRNGVIITMEDSQPTAEAIAIRGRLILAVGSDEEISVYQDPQTVVVDLQGLALMPGFIDGHTHMLAFPDRTGRTLEEAQQVALSLGFTGMTEMYANNDILEYFRQAEQQGALRLRVNVFPVYNDANLDEARRRILFKTWYPANPPLLDPGSMLRIPGIKIFVDGDNGSYERGCWGLSDPFISGSTVLESGACGSERGDLYWEQDELNRVVREAQNAGYRVAFHAMGDAAIEAALNAIEYALDGGSNLVYRHQIEHNSLIRPDLLSRYPYLNIATSVRGYADFRDQSYLDTLFGSYRKGWYFNRYKLPLLGIHAYVETDYLWTVDPADRYASRTTDPLMEIYGLVTHRFVTPDGSSFPPDPILTGLNIPLQRALEMLTVEPAWAVSMEDYLGSLKAGKFADLIILSGDPLSMDPNDLYKLTVYMTMVNGVTEYCAPGMDAYCPVLSEP